MLCLKVPKSKGEEVRNKLLEKDLLHKKGKIESTDKYIFLPIEENQDHIHELKKFDYELIEKEIEIREEKERNYRNLVDLTDDKKAHLPSSYDIIGEIALIKIPDELIGYEKEIGEAILKTHKNLKSVFRDKGVKGDFRIRDLEHLAGKESTETVHREHGTEVMIDVSKAYFSPRLATERWRVVGCVKKGEVILDMFAGVGPYTVLIGKHAKVKQIHSIDINPEAIKYLRKNIEKNDLEEIVTIYEGNAENIAPDLSCDRVIMNLPHTSKSFINPALSAIDDQGVLHYYEIINEERKEKRIKEISQEIKNKGYSVELENKRVVRTYSARDIQIVYDLSVMKKDRS